MNGSFVKVEINSISESEDLDLKNIQALLLGNHDAESLIKGIGRLFCQFDNDVLDKIVEIQQAETKPQIMDLIKAGFEYAKMIKKGVVA